jgi:hypothetical protein
MYPRRGESGAPGLFPAGHTNYVLPDEKKDISILFAKDFNCPICKGIFNFPIARKYRLRKESTDYDMRTVYSGINLTHYYAVSCPKCLFSSIANVFEKASNKKANEILKKGTELKELVNIRPGAMDADSLFARLYLALEFMPLGYRKRDTIAHTAQLWLNISWLYRDCGDVSMEQFAIEQALAAHLKLYSNVDLDGENLQRVCLVIGELSYKTGDIANARRFFFEAKTNKEGSAQFSDMADERLSELKNKTGKQPVKTVPR